MSNADYYNGGSLKPSKLSKFGSALSSTGEALQQAGSSSGQYIKPQVQTYIDANGIEHQCKPSTTSYGSLQPQDTYNSGASSSGFGTQGYNSYPGGSSSVFTGNAPAPVAHSPTPSYHPATPSYHPPPPASASHMSPQSYPPSGQNPQGAYGAPPGQYPQNTNVASPDQQYQQQPQGYQWHQQSQQGQQPQEYYGQSQPPPTGGYVAPDMSYAQPPGPDNQGGYNGQQTAPPPYTSSGTGIQPSSQPTPVGVWNPDGPSSWAALTQGR